MRDFEDYEPIGRDDEEHYGDFYHEMEYDDDYDYDYDYDGLEPEETE